MSRTWHARKPRQRPPMCTCGHREGDCDDAFRSRVGAAQHLTVAMRALEVRPARRLGFAAPRNASAMPAGLRALAREVASG